MANREGYFNVKYKIHWNILRLEIERLESNYYLEFSMNIYAACCAMPKSLWNEVIKSLGLSLLNVVCSVIYSFKSVNVCTFPCTIHLSPYRRNGCCFSPSFRSKTRRQSCQGGPTPPSVWKRMQRTLIPARNLVNASSSERASVRLMGM